MALSPRRRQIIEYLKKHLSEEGYSPSLRQMCRALGLKSHGSLLKHLAGLEEQGLIERTPGQYRSWRPVDRAPGPSIPLLGSIAAGTPLLAQDNREDELPMDPAMFGCRDCLAVRVRGESMIEVGILDGDMAILEPCETAPSGTIVAALIEGLEAEATLKRLRTKGRTLRLEAANPRMADLEFQGEDRARVRIIGRLVGVVRAMPKVC